MIAVDLLTRPVYGYSETDGILGLSAGTARRWIDGYARRSTVYEPIVRPLATGDAWVTWGEFVEVRILAEYRDAKIPTAHLRGAVQGLRTMFDVDHPLAHLEPYLAADGNELAIDLARVSGNDDEGLLVARTGQRVLDERARRVIDSASLGAIGDSKVVIEMVADSRYRSIVVNPDRRGGEPTVQGRRIPASTLAGLVQAGARVADVAADFELSMEIVQDAVGYAGGRMLAA